MNNNEIKHFIKMSDDYLYEVFGAIYNYLKDSEIFSMYSPAYGRPLFSIKIGRYEITYLTKFFPYMMDNRVYVYYYGDSYRNVLSDMPAGNNGFLFCYFLEKALETISKCGVKGVDIDTTNLRTIMKNID